MPSPFPGVDPYIEAQGRWEGFHPRFMAYGADALNEILPEHYVADLGEHVHLVDLAVEEPKMVIPDVLVARKNRRSVAGPRRTRTAGGTALLEPVKIPLPRVKMEVRDVWIEIRRLPKRTPVTVIEVLSPTNKTGEGFAEYLKKRRATIRQKVHLVELDLLLGGERLPMDGRFRPATIYALVSRAEQRPESRRLRLDDPGPPARRSRSRSAPDPDVVSTWAGLRHGLRAGPLCPVDRLQQCRPRP